MAGTKEGGRKAAATNKLRHGEGFYARIGAKGGAQRSHWRLRFQPRVSTDCWSQRRSEV